MNLRQVKQWSVAQGINQATLRGLCAESLLLAVSRLLQGIHREQYGCPSMLKRAKNGSWWLIVGQNALIETPITGPLPFGRIEAVGLPQLVQRGQRRPLATSLAFLRALRSCFTSPEALSAIDRLKADFRNSLANLVLNRVLFHLRSSKSCAIEPTFEGHTYYPFPGLRVGPSLHQIATCSNLSAEPIELPLVLSSSLRFISIQFGDYHTCIRQCTGTNVRPEPSLLVPVHPWQLQLSPVLQALLQLGIIEKVSKGIAATPLASQRTCRIVATGFDVKLPVDVTLTGEHRLLYPINVLNAPAISQLAKAVLAKEGPGTMTFQYDLASILHTDPHIGSHLAAIIRCPIPTLAGESVIPALNLWTDPKLAQTLLATDTREGVYEVFSAYCRVLIEGPLHFYVRWGMAFEPHLQNVLVRIRNRLPVGIIIRDLDGTILNPQSLVETMREHSLQFSTPPWTAMPTYAAGGHRLAHALFFGHIGHVMSYLSKQSGIQLATLTRCVDNVWSELTHSLALMNLGIINELCVGLHKVKSSLAMRLARSMTMAFH